MTTTPKITEVLPGMFQMVLRSDESKAVATRFSGSKEWAVTGFYEGSDKAYRCYDGPKSHFSRADAIEMMDVFVNRGRQWL